jgi:ArsR family transcriptional regulator
MAKTAGVLTKPCARRFQPAAFTQPAAVFKALGHPTRLMVVAALADGPRCVCELTGYAGCDASTMSNHLAVLRNAGVLRADRRGSQIFYSVARSCVLDMIGCLGRC